MSITKHFLSSVAVLGLVGGGAALHARFAGSGGASGIAHAAPGIPIDGSIADVTEHTIDSVVNISNMRVVRQTAWDADDGDGQGTPGSVQEQKQLASKGSGVIVTATGRILTNAHVVDGADELLVTLHDGSEMAAKVIGKDTQADLAVIQLKGVVPPLKPLPIGDSNKLRLGDVVLAIGDGMGLGKAVSMGIVSAKGRSTGMIEDYEDFIQTDAVINPGNSGGALIDMKGELVGINTAILSKTGGYQGIGFAIPTSMAKPIMDMLVKDGHVSRGYLGVGTATATPALAQQYKLGASKGAIIDGIEKDGPAAKAGLVAGDVVVGLDGVDVKTGDGLRMAIAMIRPGTTVALDVVHQDAKKQSVKIQLAERPLAYRRTR